MRGAPTPRILTPKALLSLAECPYGVLALVAGDTDALTKACERHRIGVRYALPRAPRDIRPDVYIARRFPPWDAFLLDMTHYDGVYEWRPRVIAIGPHPDADLADSVFDRVA